MTNAEHRRSLDPAIVEVLRELGDLKRIHSAGRDGSIATRLFERGWAEWLAGGDRQTIAWQLIGAGLAAARLGDLDRAKLAELDLSPVTVREVLAKAIDSVTGALDPVIVNQAKEALTREQGLAKQTALPELIGALRHQPRAGVTAPGLPRIMLQPEENHAEHSFIVALYAMVLAPSFGAEPVTAFWHGMIHHLHSAAMPDAGYSGEVLLGEHLASVIENARGLALRQLPVGIAEGCRRTFAEIATDESAEAKAFHAADVIDRVLEIQHHLRRSQLTMKTVLGKYGLVHDGPVKAFHDRVLRETELP